MSHRVLATAVLLAAAAWGQQASVTLDGKTIAVKYSPAAVKAHGALAFHTDADLVFKGATVPKGDYSLFLVSEGNNWLLAISKASGRDPKMDLGRVAMTVAKPAAPVASGRVVLTKTAARAAKLEIEFDNNSFATTFRLDRVAGDSEW